MEIISELKRRNVFKVAGVYLGVSWLVLQLVAVIAAPLHLPLVFSTALTVILVIAFPFVCIFAWAFELTPEGIKRTTDVCQEDSIAESTSKKFNYILILVLVSAILLLLFDRLRIQSGNQTTPATQTTTAETTSALDDYTASIAVLPFVDLSPNNDQAYFSDGIAEEILNVLVKIKSLSVASRTSSFGFKGQEALGLPAIAEKLKVRHILEGSVRKSGNNVRITAQLIDAQNDAHLWSQTYDRELTTENLFSIQDEIANAVVRQMSNLLGSTAEDFDVNVVADTNDIAAYDLYLKAHHLFTTRSNSKDIEQSIDLFKQATEKDANFARGWAGLAAAYFTAPSWGIESADDSIKLATEAANKAIGVDDTIALPYATLGVIYGLMLKQYEESLNYFAEALQRSPKETTALLWRGLTFLNLGYFKQAQQSYLTCLDIDPAAEICRRHLAISYLYQGEENAAIESFEQGALRGFTGIVEPFIRLYAEKGNKAAVIAYLYDRYAVESALPQIIELDYRVLMDKNYKFEQERSVIETIWTAAGYPIDWDKDTYTAFYYGYFEKVNEEITNYTPLKWRRYPMEWRNSPYRKQIIIKDKLPDYWRIHGFPAQCKALPNNDFSCD